MLSSRYRVPLSATLLVATATTVLMGCSTGGGGRSNAPDPAQPEGAPGKQTIGLSPAGVTTRIDVPAQSTEEQYAKACLASKEWMTAKGGDPHTMVEPYLQELQTSTSSSPATFNGTWAGLSQAQQAAVIIAVQAAADGGC